MPFSLQGWHLPRLPVFWAAVLQHERVGEHAPQQRHPHRHHQQAERQEGPVLHRGGHISHTSGIHQGIAMR